MPCACQGQSSQPAAPEPQFEVVYSNGTRETVTGEHNAKVKVTMGGPGTTYSRL